MLEQTLMVVCSSSVSDDPRHIAPPHAENLKLQTSLVADIVESAIGIRCHFGTRIWLWR